MEGVVEAVVEVVVDVAADEVMRVVPEEVVATLLDEVEAVALDDRRDDEVIVGETGAATTGDSATVQTALPAAPSRVSFTVTFCASICAIPVVANFPVMENPIHATSAKPIVVI